MCDRCRLCDSVLVPAVVLGIVGWRRRRSIVSAAFWLPFLVLSGAAVAYAVCLQPNYLRMAIVRLSSAETMLLRKLSAEPFAFVSLVGAAAVTAWMVGRVTQALAASPRRLGRTLALAVALLAAYGYWIRPHLTFAVSGEERTLVWLSWYVGSLARGILCSGIATNGYFIGCMATSVFVLPRAVHGPPPRAPRLHFSARHGIDRS